MPHREFRISVDGEKGPEEMGQWLADRASGILHDLFPSGEWRWAMVKLAERINERVREDDAGVLPSGT